MNVIILLSWFVIGLVTGALAWLAIPDRKPKQMLMTVFLGIAAAFLGSLLSWMIFADPEAPFVALSIIVELVTAVIVLGLLITVLHFRKLRKARIR